MILCLTHRRAIRSFKSLPIAVVHHHRYRFTLLGDNGNKIDDKFVEILFVVLSVCCLSRAKPKACCMFQQMKFYWNKAVHQFTDF